MAAPDPSAELMRMINWYQVSQALHVAASLGVADHLKDGQKSYDVVARACGAHPPSLESIAPSSGCGRCISRNRQRGVLPHSTWPPSACSSITWSPEPCSSTTPRSRRGGRRAAALD